MQVWRELSTHRTRAVRHVRRRRFAPNIAEDAVHRALEIFAHRARDPAFTLPKVPKAWLFFWSVGCAHSLIREAARSTPVSSQDVMNEVLSGGAEDSWSPDARLNSLATVEEKTAESRLFSSAFSALLPQDRETFEAEVAREDRGDPATPRHRKRLERARHRCATVFARFGIRRPR
jgi:DNA-directed RNA polymerase specialized sigma24 family protein